MKNLEFKPVSMPCTQEQWDNELRPALDRYDILYEWISDFDDNPLITNNYTDTPNFISNVSEINKYDFGRTFISEFNVKVFIEACGVEYTESEASGIEHTEIKSSKNNCNSTALIEPNKDRDNEIIEGIKELMDSQVISICNHIETLGKGVISDLIINSIKDKYLNKK